MIRNPELIIEVKRVPLCNPAADRAPLCLHDLKDEKKGHNFLLKSEIILPEQYYISTEKSRMEDKQNPVEATNMLMSMVCSVSTGSLTAALT